MQSARKVETDTLPALDAVQIIGTGQTVGQGTAQGTGPQQGERRGAEPASAAQNKPRPTIRLVDDDTINQDRRLNAEDRRQMRRRQAIADLDLRCAQDAIERTVRHYEELETIDDEETERVCCRVSLIVRCCKQLVKRATRKS